MMIKYQGKIDTLNQRDNKSDFQTLEAIFDQCNILAMNSLGKS